MQSICERVFSARNSNKKDQEVVADWVSVLCTHVAIGSIVECTFVVLALCFSLLAHP